MDEDRHGEDIAAIHPEDWPRLQDRLDKLARSDAAKDAEF